MNGSRLKGIQAVGIRAAGFLLLLLCWQLLSNRYSGILLAKPADTFKAIAELITNREFLLDHFIVSLKRILFGIGLAIFVGAVLGVLAGLVPPVGYMLEPLRWMLSSVPGVVIVVVFMLWFGMGNLMVVSITVCLITPVIYVNIAEAMSSVDGELLDMARIYRFSFPVKLRKIYVPTIARAFFSGVVIATGNSTRIVVLSEVLGANEGIGYRLAIARSNLDTPELYALALISMIFVGIVEFFLLNPVKKLSYGNTGQCHGGTE